MVRKGYKTCIWEMEVKRKNNAILAYDKLCWRFTEHPS